MLLEERVRRLSSDGAPEDRASAAAVHALRDAVPPPVGGRLRRHLSKVRRPVAHSEAARRNRSRSR